MNPISGIPSIPTSQGVREDFAKVGQSQFLHLLVTQLRNQNPFSTVSNQEFLAQLAQFSTLEGINDLNRNLTDKELNQELLDASSLLDRQVTYAAGASGVQTGQVQGVEKLDGEIYLKVNGQSVPLAAITEVQGILE